MEESAGSDPVLQNFRGRSNPYFVPERMLILTPSD